MTAAKAVRGEELEIPERVILAPAVGVFQPLSPDTVPPAHEVEVADEEPGDGEIISEGQVVGVIEARGQKHPVRSAFAGLLVGLLAHPGERVREGQPVAWMRVI